MVNGTGQSPHFCVIYSVIWCLSRIRYTQTIMIKKFKNIYQYDLALTLILIGFGTIQQTSAQDLPNDL